MFYMSFNICLTFLIMFYVPHGKVFMFPVSSGCSFPFGPNRIKVERTKWKNPVKPSVKRASQAAWFVHMAVQNSEVVNSWCTTAANSHSLEAGTCTFLFCLAFLRDQWIQWWTPPTPSISAFPIRLSVVMWVCSVLLSHCVCIRVLLWSHERKARHSP